LHKAVTNYTHAPEPLVFRPTQAPMIQTTTPEFEIVGGGLDTQGAIILGIVGGIGVLVIILLIILLIRYYYKQKRVYKTYEAKDAQYFDNADYAVASGSTRQPEVQNKKEFYL